MHITIAQRFRPYSHLSGELCVIPGSLLAVRIFPALVIVYDIGQTAPKEITRHSWNVQGPVKNFAVQQDLEKGNVRVWGHAENGYFCYRIAKSDHSYAIQIEKAPADFSHEGTSNLPECVPVEERLSLGVGKQQDWSFVKRRHDMAEVFPFWLRLGTMTPATNFVAQGTAALLTVDSLQNLFLAGFEGILFPRLQDEGFHGFTLPALNQEMSPAVLLSEGARLIRSLFFQQEEQRIYILPLLPHEFSAGRFINIDCGSAGQLDFEWRSRKLRRMVFRCQQDDVFQFVFPKKLKTYRLREQPNIRGVLCGCHEPQNLVKGHTYYFDLFEF